MALNVYPAEQRIFFSKTPTEYFGWYASDTSWASETMPFKTPEKREEFVRAVEAKVKELGLKTERDPDEIAAMIALKRHGGEESYELCHAVLETKIFPEADDIYEISEALEQVFLDILNRPD